MSDTPLSIPEYDEHGRIIVTPHQVLDQVVDNAQRLADQANHNALLTDETVFAMRLRSCVLSSTVVPRNQCLQNYKPRLLLSPRPCRTPELRSSRFISLKNSRVFEKTSGNSWLTVSSTSLRLLVFFLRMTERLFLSPLC
jgi:hypothetical protein